jgi:uncharacterized membrane protein
VSKKFKYPKKVVVTKNIDLDADGELPYIIKSRYTIALIAITIFSLILRFYNISTNSLWLDEVSQLNLSSQSIAAIWQNGIAPGLYSPIFSYITYIMLFFGRSEFILRLVSAILGVLTIPLFYYIGTELKDKNVGLISATLATVSPFCIYYSQEAYCYSTDLFFFAIAILFYLRATRTSSYKEWILFGITSAVSFWVHFYIIVPLFVMYLHAIYVYRKEIINFFLSEDPADKEKAINTLKPVTIGSIIALVIASPLIFVAIQRYTVMASTAVTYGTLGWTMVTSSVNQFFFYNDYISAISIIFMIIGIIAMLFYNRSKALFGALFLVLPLLISVILSTKMTMNPRYLIVILPVLYTLIAIGLYQFSKLWNSKYVVITLIIGVLLVTAIPLYTYYTTPTNEDWRGYAGLLTQSTKSGDIIVTLPGYISQPLDYYYYNSTDNTQEYYLYNVSDINQVIANKRNATVYFVVTPDIMATNPNGEVVQWLNQNTNSLGQYVGIYTFVK